MTNRGPRRRAGGIRSARRRAAALTVSGALVAGLTTGCWAEPSAMPAVRDFLIAWQVGNYEAAARNTIGVDREEVADALSRVGRQLDAASLRLSLGTGVSDSDVDQIVQRGDEADARFTVKIEIGRASCRERGQNAVATEECRET